jgi:hypothetical protein
MIGNSASPNNRRRAVRNQTNRNSATDAMADDVMEFVCPSCEATLGLPADVQTFACPDCNEEYSFVDEVEVCLRHETHSNSGLSLSYFRSSCCCGGVVCWVGRPMCSTLRVPSAAANSSILLIRSV